MICFVMFDTVVTLCYACYGLLCVLRFVMRVTVCYEMTLNDI